MRRGFTLLEVIFVIVIMGVLSKFGVEVLYTTYENYIYSNTYNKLAGRSELALKQIANRLQYRIKDLTIARIDKSGQAIAIGDASETTLKDATVLEWVGIDIDGWRSTGTPTWSGLVDLNNLFTNKDSLASPNSNAGKGAVFFIGSDVEVKGDGAWFNAMQAVDITGNALVSDFGGQDVFEFYQFSKSAYAIELKDRTLTLYSNYAPWSGETMKNGQILMENVTTFQFRSLGDTMLIQLCVGDNNLTLENKEYSICKEKVVF